MMRLFFSDASAIFNSDQFTSLQSVHETFSDPFCWLHRLYLKLSRHIEGEKPEERLLKINQLPGTPRTSQTDEESGRVMFLFLKIPKWLSEKYVKMNQQDIVSCSRNLPSGTSWWKRATDMSNDISTSDSLSLAPPWCFNWGKPAAPRRAKLPFNQLGYSLSVNSAAKSHDSRLQWREIQTCKAALIM